MAEKAYCSERVYDGSRCDFQGHRCSHRMKVVRNGEPYCNLHDPEKVEAKRVTLEAKWQAQRDTQKEIRASAARLADELCAGRPEYSMLSGKGRYTGNIVLTAEEAQRLIAQLERQPNLYALVPNAAVRKGICGD